MAADGTTPVGTFGSDTNFQPLCTGNVRIFQKIYCKFIMAFLQTAATHTNRDDKTEVAVMWTAPPAGTGEIFFR